MEMRSARKNVDGCSAEQKMLVLLLQRDAVPNIPITRTERNSLLVISLLYLKRLVVKKRHDPHCLCELV
ncbi:hypothetical protein V5799_008736 [Amblyomma americanum]|uniref:Uncharacterized protein n=1 Tax=Amblyomma americanum TaxID=6943 RepID=A0AAQ4FCK5_AMBAM